MDKKSTNPTQSKTRVRQRYSANLTPQCCKKSGSYKALAVPPGVTMRKPTANVVKVTQYVTDRNKLPKKIIPTKQDPRQNIKQKTIRIQLFDAEQIINGSKPREEHKDLSERDLQIGLNSSIERDDDISEMHNGLSLANTVRATTATIIPVFKCKAKPSSVGFASLTQQPSMMSVASLSSFDISEARQVLSPTPVQSDE